MRHLSLALLVTLSLASPAAAETRLWLASWSASGIDDAEAQRLLAQAWSELKAAGATDAGLPVDPTCATTAGCVRERLARAEAAIALELKLVRAGPLLQVSVIVHSTDAEPSREERLVQTAELAKGATLLPATLLDEVRAESATSSSMETPAGGASSASSANATSPAATAPKTRTTRAPGEDEGIPVLGIAGLGLVATGLVIAVLGAAVAAAGNEVLLDPATSADEKAGASFYGPFAIGAAVTGGVLVLAGGGLAAVGMWDAE